MKFIQLPSGLVLNLAHIAFVTTDDDGGTHVSFSATYSTQRGCVPMSIVLKKADAEALVRWLQSQGLEKVG
jgi:hypothetical protein